MLSSRFGRTVQAKAAAPVARGRTWGAALAIVLAGATLAPAHAQHSAQVAKGLGWLQGQVGQDGRLGAEAASIATPTQSRSEALHTLSMLGTPAATIAPLQAALLKDADLNTEYLARRALALASSGLSQSSMITLLQERQNGDDGGYGGAAGYASYALDTALVLRAQKASPAFGAPSVLSALSYLSTIRNPDGSYSSRGSQGRGQLYVTVHALLAASAWSGQPGAGDIAASGQQWLLDQRNASMHYGNAAENALALWVFTGLTSHGTILQPLVDALHAEQQADGSWNGDPYVTAIALRALHRVAQPPSAAGGAVLRATVVDSASATGLAGVTVQMLGASGAATTTDIVGQFKFASAPTGTQTVRFSRVGYATREIAFTLIAGQDLNAGSISLNKAALTASISGVIRNASGTALPGVTVAVGTAAALTGPTGAYTLEGLSPGPATLTVSAPNYQTITASIELAAGNNYSFSPRIQASGSTPPAVTSITGIVIDATSKAVIANASLKLGALSATSAANGSFTFTVAPGAFSIGISAVGYQSVTVSGSSVAGINNIGNLALAKLPTTSTLSGQVTNAATKAPVAGASVKVDGQGATALTGVDGRYTIGALTGSNFILRASAVGFQAKAETVSLTQSGAAVIDLSLQPSSAGATDISFLRAQTLSQSYAPSGVIPLEVVLSNGAASAAAVQVSALVLDSKGNVVHEYLGSPIIGWQGLAYGNNAVTVAAQSTLDLMIDWNTTRLPGGEYQIRAKAQDAGGRMLAEAESGFSVITASALAGGVTADPPLAQAGAKTPISLTADIMNSGNATMAAGELKLRMILERADPAENRPSETVMRTLTTGVPMTGAVKIKADRLGNLYTVNAGDRKIVRTAANGAQSVLATLPAGKPVDISLDPEGNVLVAIASPATVYTTTQQGVTTATAMGSGLSSLSAMDVAPDGAILVTGINTLNETLLVQRSVAGVETVLQSNGLSGPVSVVKAADGTLVVSNYNDGTLAKIDPASGRIRPFVRGLKNPRGIAIGPDGNFYVAASATNKIVKVTPDGAMSDFASVVQPYDLAFDAAGTLFVTRPEASAIMKIGSGGAVELFAQGVASGPQAMRYDAAGALWITNGDNSLRKVGTDDRASVVATGLVTPRGIAVLPNGDILVAENGANRIARFSNGVKSVFATGLGQPYGIAVAGDGTVHVTENNLHRVSRFDQSGTRLGFVDSRMSNPSVTATARNGDMFVQSSIGLARYRAGALSMLLRSFTYSYWTPDSASDSLLAVSGTSVLRVSAAGTVTTIKSALPFSPRAIALAEDGAVLLLDTNNRKVHKLALDGTLSDFVVLPSAIPAGEMKHDATGKVFLRLSSGVFYRLMTDGTLTQLSHTVPDTIYVWSAVGDARLALSTYYKTWLLDTASTTTTLWLGNQGAHTGAHVVTSVAGDVAGTFMAIDNWGHTAYMYAADGRETTRFHGFANPKDIVWTGSELRFSAGSNHLFSLDDAGIVQRKAGTLPANFLVQRGADTLGVNATGTVNQWTGAAGSGYSTYASLSATLSGIAAHADGGLALGDTQSSRVVVLNAAKQAVKEFPGLLAPRALAFDGAGRLYVADNTGGAVSRFDSTASPLATKFATVSYPTGLAFDAAGSLFVSRQSGVDRHAINGAMTVVGQGYSISGMVADGGAVFGVDYYGSQLRKWQAGVTGDPWPVLAAGFSGPVALRARADGSVLVLNKSNNTVVQHADGKLSLLGNVPGGMNAMDVRADGVVAVAGNDSMAARIANGVTTPYALTPLLGAFTITGVADAADGTLTMLGSNTSTPALNSMVELTITAPAAAPREGTVVYETSVPMTALEANGTYAHYDFGTWIAPYGGDFKMEIERTGIAGKLANFIHVGANAQSTLTAASAEVPPGDSELGVCLDMTGADFTSISRVEMGQVRPISMSGVPNGMAGDRAGNLYVTDKNSLYRTTATGVNTLIAGGMSLAFGLATDNKENFYVASRNAATSLFEVLRIDLAGKKTVVANLGVGTANGVQLNSKDEILVGSPGKLLKVTQAGVVSVVTTAGFPAPRGIAVDGRDNTYVQNEEDRVSMVKPDGTTLSIFSKSDGTIDPEFEGDGYPNIAADCADNFYIAPSNWARLNQSGEEHSLAQVVPSTGKVALLFDTARVDASLNDIDYLAFDRFSNRLLMWNDGSNRIWQVPVTCGAIGVQAHLVSQPGQVLSGASMTPSATVARADGSTEYVFSLRDVTSTGAKVCFSASQKGFQLGEQRKVIGSGFISFQNSFGGSDVTVPLAVPNVRAANLVTLGAATDKPEYAANEFAQLSAALVNTNAAGVSGDLRVDVHDAGGALLSSVIRQGVTMAAGETLRVDGAYAVGASAAGAYGVRATLSDAKGLLAQATTAFKVLADKLDAAAKSELVLDKRQYGAGERVTISSRAMSQSRNLTLENLTLQVRLFDAAGTELFARTNQINQLGAGQMLDFVAQYQQRAAAAGIYKVTQVLRDAEGRAYDQHEVTYTVGASAETGYGLLGTIDVTPTPVRLGESAAIGFRVDNKGNGAFDALPLTVSVFDPVRNAIVAEFAHTHSLAVGANYSGANGWTAVGTAGDQLIALLRANVAGKAVTLASAPFALMPAAQSQVKLDIKQTGAHGSRVLVLVSCNDGETSTPGADGKSPCETLRAQTIAEALTELGVSHTIVTSEEAFRAALRSGAYNTYWISGKEDKLHGDLPAEVREATFGGEGLILDGVHDNRNKVITAVSGVRWKGKIGEPDLPVNLAGDWYAPQRLGTLGRAYKPELDGGTQQARFDGSRPQSFGPAIVSNVYGNGRSALFAFDLAASLRAERAWLPVLGTTLKMVAPRQSASVTPGAMLGLRTSIANLAEPVTLSVRSQLPAGAQFVDASPLAIHDGAANRVDWNFSLNQPGNQDLLLALRAPGVVGSYAVETQVASVEGGVAKPYGAPLSHAFSVVGASQSAVLATAAFKALPLTRNSDIKARDGALLAFNAAMVAFNLNSHAGYQEAIAKLVQVTDVLGSLSTVDASAARLHVDRVLREAQWRWSQSQPAP